MGVPTKTLIGADAIPDYIPQREPVILVDALVEVTENGSLSTLKIEDDNLFCSQGVFDECGVIEHIAQSAALRIGYCYKSRGEQVPLGFIGSVSNFEIESLPKVGELLLTQITVEQEVFGITLLSAQVHIGARCIARCRMKVAVNQN